MPHLRVSSAGLLERVSAASFRQVCHDIMLTLRRRVHETESGSTRTPTV